MIVYIFNYELKSSNMNQFEKFQSAISITKIKDSFIRSFQTETILWVIHLMEGI